MNDSWQEMLAGKLPYRVIDTAAGVWALPHASSTNVYANSKRWMEVTSTSNCTTFQARRLST